MKKRNDITEKIRDGWVDQWKRKNAQGTGYYSFLTTQDVKSEGSKNRSPDFENPHKDRNFLSLNESFYYLILLFDPCSGQLSSAPKSIIAVTAAKIGIMIEASTLMALNPYNVVMSMAQPATISMGHSGIIILNSALSKRTTALENKSIFTPNQPINDKAKAILTMPAPALPNAIFTNK